MLTLRTRTAKLSLDSSVPPAATVAVSVVECLAAAAAAVSTPDMVVVPLAAVVARFMWPTFVYPIQLILADKHKMLTMNSSRSMLAGRTLRIYSDKLVRSIKKPFNKRQLLPYGTPPNN